MRWVQYIYCYIFFSSWFTSVNSRSESPTIQHSFETLLERPSWFLYVSHPGSVMLSIKCPQESLSLSLSCFRTLLLGCFGSSLSCFCSLLYPNPLIVTVERVQFYYPNTKADLKPKEIVAHGHIALSASLTSESKGHFISNHGLKTI